MTARANAYVQAAAHLRTIEWNGHIENKEMDGVAAKLEKQADKILSQRPPFCRTLPYSQWCDANGPGDFMGHTCEPGRPT